MQFRQTPLPARVFRLPDMSDADWAAYNRIKDSEGAVPVYLRPVDDVIRNHAIAERAMLAATGDVVCFLRKKHQRPDGTLGVDIHVVPAPEQLDRLFMMLGGDMRLCLSGRVLTGPPETWASWIDASRGMHVSILLDADPRDILSVLTPNWALLTWHIDKLEEVQGQEVLFLFPVATTPQAVALFQPCTWSTADTTLRRLRPPAFPLSVKHLGVRIEGVPPEILALDWTIPLDLVWIAKRYLSEEFVFG